MKLAKLFLFNYSIFLFFLISCSILKKSDSKVTKGNYDIIKVEKTDSEKAQIICVVYDKKNNAPIVDAAISIDDLKLTGLSKTNGRCEFEVTGAKSVVTVINVGNITIKTKPINFKPYTKTEIKFLLGTAIIYEK
jgi:hypothetical protein